MSEWQLHRTPPLNRAQVKRLRAALEAGTNRKLLERRFGISADTMRRVLGLAPLNRKVPK